MLMTALPAVEAAAVESAGSIELVPRPGTTIEFAGREYQGNVSIGGHGDGLAVVERVTLDAYLAGIREVPFSWEDAALQAQAVAARTYLAWVLWNGGYRPGRTYGFDICATDQCQVYAGTGLIQGPDGDRWAAAIAATAGEILVYDDAPAQSLYSSSAGTRTRSVEDVWGGDGVPYLTAVDSPEENVTPYWEWTISMPARVFGEVLAAGGHGLEGALKSVTVDQTDDGGGPWRVVVRAWTGERRSLAPTRLRAVFNVHGPDLYPALFPARRPDGRRWPQTVLSYTFTAGLFGAEPPVREDLIPWLLPEDIPQAGRVEITGTGWGHGVGMSQWGAQAMALAGSGFAEILGHYYGGLVPQPADDLIPTGVAVGLAWRQEKVVVRSSGAFEAFVDGNSLGAFGPGTWTFFDSDGAVTYVAPDRYRGRFGAFWID
jgi:stage II sporulation protein D